MIENWFRSPSNAERSASGGTSWNPKYPLFEWCVTAMMLGIALCIYLTPKTIEMGAFRFMTAAGFSAVPTFILFTIAGTLRAVALIANGKWPYGAQARAVGAMIGGFLWFQMMFALILLEQVTNTLSVGIPVYMALTVGEIVSCYRVAFDPGRRPSTEGGQFGARSQHSR